MRKIRYVVARPVVVSRPSVYESGVTEIRWDVDPYYGEHDTNIGAKRAYVEAIEPELKGASDSYIKRWFNGTPRNLRLAKILKVS